MTRLGSVLLSFVLAGLALAQPEKPLKVYFSPGSSCTDAILQELAEAKSTIHLQAYSFTSPAIARALADAAKRGVKVIAILDASNRNKNYSAADFLAHEGIDTYIDSQHAIAHNKIIIIDSAVSSPARSISPKPPTKRTPRTSSSFPMPPWPRNTRETGRSTSPTPSITRGDKRASMNVGA